MISFDFFFIQEFTIFFFFKLIILNLSKNILFVSNFDHENFS